ncbi:MAG: penicillin-binding protein 2 [Desulfosalsimonadaceae bacterium]
MKQNKITGERIRRRNCRIMVVGVLFTLCYLIIGLKAFYVQVVQDTDLSRLASGECKRAVQADGRRGTIYDVNMKELAVSMRTVAVGAHPEAVDSPGGASGKIADTLDLSRSSVKRKLGRDTAFVWLDRKVSSMQAEKLKSLAIEGLEYIPGFSRLYPNKSLAAQVLGFTGVEGGGLEGLEYYYNDYLQGEKKQCTIAKDAIGRIFYREVESSSRETGRNVVLTIDANIQYITENALEAAVKKYRARSGLAVVMVPGTGAIRAIAHYPTFNPNSFSDYPRYRWRNRAITDPFEPGSAMKIFTIGAALESGRLSPHTLIDCEDGRYRTGGHVIKDIHPHEMLPLREVVKYSSNIGAAKIAEKTGAESLYKTLKDFGFGQKTGIDCPGETSGRLRHYQNWRTIDRANIAFGQGVSVSAVQLISAVSAIANRGILMKPRMVRAITDENGKVLESLEPENRGRAISVDTAEQLKSMMFAATSSEGTGSKAVPAGYPVCGKTGTAQKLTDEGTYENCEYNAVFVGFSPKDEPELAALVVVNEPRKQHFGGVVAAPAFRSIILEAFNYMDVPPHHKDRHYDLAVKSREPGA